MAEKRNKFRNKEAVEAQGSDPVAVADVTEKPAEPKPRRKPQKPQPEVKPESPSAGWRERLVIVRRVFADERTQKFWGLTLVLLASYLSIALLSYFTSWKTDQDKVLAGLDVLFSADTKVTNWLGKFGAL